MSAAGVAADNTLRAVVWVGDDGTVLRQDLYLMDAKLRFERCNEPQMLKLAENCWIWKPSPRSPHRKTSP